MGAVGGVKPARARGEGARPASLEGWWGSRGRGERSGWARRWKVNLRCGWEVALFVWTPLERLKGNCLNGGDECRVGKCE